jgi:hypothetical protein
MIWMLSIPFSHPLMRFPPSPYAEQLGDQRAPKSREQVIILTSLSGIRLQQAGDDTGDAVPVLGFELELAAARGGEPCSGPMVSSVFRTIRWSVQNVRFAPSIVSSRMLRGACRIARGMK